MRFLANGPSIPNELLLAHDQDRVVFFCGAGVSCAKAKLLDFFELAEAVTETLGVQQDASVMKIIAEIRGIRERTGVEGLIPADRIFGLLERDFLSRDIQEAVARALTPTVSPNLQAHQTLLRLATNQQDRVRLVTTNFDRLFDDCRPDLPTYTPPKLPLPLGATELNGVVYLHGKINSTGDGAEGNELVLSISEFGRAYLSEGWATSFVREILDQYMVVFVGYSADDPPVQYLLEALNRASESRVYAFQPGDSNHAESRWQHKGVTAIAYDEANDHAALWDTLDAWAIKSGNPDDWVNGVVERAKAGPETLEPHERGQVAYVISTIEGLRRFSDGDNPPPATWLCVFDPSRRYAKPGRKSDSDPFDSYSLDSDPVPDKIPPDSYYANREVPGGAWDAFLPTQPGKNEQRDENISHLRGHWSRQSPRLLAHQFQLGVWIGKVAEQPAALWWAVRQRGIHPDIQERITWQLERAGGETPAGIREAWRYLFDFWSEDRSTTFCNWHTLASEITSNGWSEIILRHFASLGKATLKVEKSDRSGPIPETRKNLCLSDLISLNVEYPKPPRDIPIPEEWLARAVVLLRRNLETARELERELRAKISCCDLLAICPIAPDEEPDGESSSRDEGLSAWVLYFISQFERLMSFDAGAAKAEFSRWPTDDQTLFARLRIWALGQSVLVPAEQFRAFLDALPDEVFWDSHHARDLLLAIVARWDNMEAETRSEIEERLVKGPKRREAGEYQDFEERKALSSLNRLHWLREQGCSLQLNLDKITEELRKVVPGWKPECAGGAARSLEGKSGWVRPETDHTALLEEPLNTTLAKTKALSGFSIDRFIEHVPFLGLSQERPVRAFAALRRAAKKKEFPEWAWNTFLNTDKRKEDRPRFTAFIAEQISRFADTELAGILRPVAEWVKKAAKVLATAYPGLFSRLVSKIIGVLALPSADSCTIIIRNNEEPDWASEATNSPTGRLAQALLDDPQKEDLKEGEGFPKGWLQQVEALLVLPGDLRRHALVIFARHLSWFFCTDPQWTKENLLLVLEGESREDEQALWGGLLWNGKVHGYELFKILKAPILKIARSERFGKRSHTKILVGMLLSAWAIVDKENQERWVSNNELRDVLLDSNDDVRSRLLCLCRDQSKKGGAEWPPLLIEFLRNVWPRQIAVKSGFVSTVLCNIVFSDKTHFPELAAIVLPLLTKADSNSSVHLDLRPLHDNIVDQHPRETLELLHAVLFRTTPLSGLIK